MAGKLFDFNDASPQQADKLPIVPTQAFQDALAAAGLGRPEIHPTGQIERYDAPNEKPGKKSNWYVYFPDEIAGGAAGSWKGEGETSFTWSAKALTELTPTERQRHNERMEEIRSMREQAEKARHAEARIKAREKWDTAKEPVPGHAYLLSKKVKAYGLRQDATGRLLVPVRDTEGVIHSLEHIDPHGGKKFLTGGEVKGHFHVIPGEGNTSYLVEGYATGATIHEATGAEVIVAFSSGNMQAVAKVYKTEKRLVVAADNDQSGAGLKGAQATGLPYIMPDTVDMDFNDLAVSKGLAEVKRQLVPPENKFARRVIATPDALRTAFLETLSLSWTVKGVIPESSSLIMIYGAPASGKSFAALDMVLCVSNHINWHGHTTKQKSVLYVAAEGQAGVLKRIEAWRQYHNIANIQNFYLLPIPCLVDNPGQLGELLTMIRSLPAMPEIIVLDTLARSMLGDENSTLDMGRLVNSCGDLHEATKAQIILIHHTGKDETRGARGAIALTGATDTMFRVVRTAEDKQYRLDCERQKDDEPFSPKVFNLRIIETGHYNADGDEVTSLVPEYDPDAEIETKKEKSANESQPRQSASVHIALRSMREAAKESGEPPTDEIKEKMGGMVLPTDLVVHIDHWRKMAYRMGISDSEEPDTRKKAFKRAKEALLKNGTINTLDGLFWEVKR